MSLLAIDIGGANLKAADGDGWAMSRRFALWRQPSDLADALKELLAHSPQVRRLAITMTGELADCFATKAQGVAHILSAVSAAAPSADPRVYLVDGRLVTPATALKSPLLAASSNWHALASFAVRFADSAGSLLIDIGSTTTDIVPLVQGEVVAQGRNDPERLVARELVYTGVERTPMFALLPECSWGGVRCPTAPEWFATAADAYVLLGDVQADPANRETADGQPQTIDAAHRRISRIVCGDPTLITLEEAKRVASEFRSAQMNLVERGINHVVGRLRHEPEKWLVSGQGEFLARRIAARFAGKIQVISMADQIGDQPSTCAPAHALAVLARERRNW